MAAGNVPVGDDVERERGHGDEEHVEEVGKEAKLARAGGAGLVCAAGGGGGSTGEEDEGECAEGEDLDGDGDGALVDAGPALEALCAEHHGEDAGDDGADLCGGATFGEEEGGESARRGCRGGCAIFEDVVEADGLGEVVCTETDDGAVEGLGDEHREADGERDGYEKDDCVEEEHLERRLVPRMWLGRGVLLSEQVRAAILRWLRSIMLANDARCGGSEAGEDGWIRHRVQVGEPRIQIRVKGGCQDGTVQQQLRSSLLAPSLRLSAESSANRRQQPTQNNTARPDARPRLRRVGGPEILPAGVPRASLRPPKNGIFEPLFWLTFFGAQIDAHRILLSLLLIQYHPRMRHFPLTLNFPIV